MGLLETQGATFSSYDLLSSSCDKTRPVAPSSVNIGIQNIIETSSRVGVNSLLEVTNACVSTLHRETSNSRYSWLLVTDIDIEMSKVITTVSSKVSAMPDAFNTSVAQFLWVFML